MIACSLTFPNSNHQNVTHNVSKLGPSHLEIKNTTQIIVRHLTNEGKSIIHADRFADETCFTR